MAREPYLDLIKKLASEVFSERALDVPVVVLEGAQGMGKSFLLSSAMDALSRKGSPLNSRSSSSGLTRRTQTMALGPGALKKQEEGGCASFSFLSLSVLFCPR